MFYEEEQLNLFGHDTWSGKTYPEHSPQTEAKTSQRSLKRSSKSANRMPMCKCVSRIRDGQNPGAITLLMEDGPLLGDYTMRSFGEYPREENASLLSQILEVSPHPKYYLSAKACRGILNRAERRGKKLPPELEAALIAQSACNEMESIEPIQQAVYVPEVAHSLKAKANCDFREDSETYVVSGIDCRNGKENGGFSYNCIHPVRIGRAVRRLTPLECERLQGYPDGWTDIGDWVDSKGKTHKAADSPRYKALGNSIALPYWKVLIKRISAQYDRDATMASLFDGIGGFPLIWEQINGKGSCLWASEIEEFPIAVTKVRFHER